ncbi:MAG: CPBP family glutamic-type intramembrane protease [Tahibacter sp.]
MVKNTRVGLGVALWLAAMAGVVILSVTVVPQILARLPHRLPLGVAIAVSMLQSGALVAVAVWAGITLSRPLGLGAPVFEAALSGTGVGAALRPQLIPAAMVGLVVGAALVLLERIAPAELLALGNTYEIPLAAKLLYGRITEETLMRWGLMTVFIWLPWRFLQKRAAPPRLIYVVGGIVSAAVLFGVAHLPAVAGMGAPVTPAIATFVVVGNTVPALLFGYLYWRWGLEAAMIAHALAHLVSVLAGAA